MDLLLRLSVVATSFIMMVVGMWIAIRFSNTHTHTHTHTHTQTINCGMFVYM